MKQCILAALLASIAFPAAALDQCRWYVNETNPDSWVEDRGSELSIHFAGDQNLTWQFIVTEVEGNPFVKRATWTDPHGQAEPSTSLFRFVEVEGRKGMMADMVFYHQTCTRPEEAPLPPA